MEIELQYLYRDSEGLLVPAEIAGFALAESLTFEITDSFYDTPDLRLRLSGCSLRVRRQSNLAHPVLTWKGPSERRDDGARQREEVEVPIDHVPADGSELSAILERYHLWSLVAAPAAIDTGTALEDIGGLRNRRSAHTYVQGLHRFELTWDRVTYPLGEPELRLEVEAKRQGAARFMADVDQELRAVYGKRLQPAPHGKAREMCRRLYPELLIRSR